MFVPGRGASLIDCGIDTTGGTVAMLPVYQQWRLTDEGKNFLKQKLRSRDSRRRSRAPRRFAVLDFLLLNEKAVGTLDLASNWRPL